MLGADILIGLVAIVALILSAEYVVRLVLALAHHFGVSDTFVGLTVLSLGTSLPEIGSHVAASIGILSGSLDYKISSGLVLGANIGSDVVQQTLIVGLVVIIGGTLTFSKDFLKKSYGMMVGTTLMCLVLGWDGTYSRWDGAILFGTFLGYMYWLYRGEQDHLKPDPIPLKHGVWVTSGLAVLGLGALLASSAIILRVTESVVHETGLGGSLIGVISLGVASALPEMLTALSGLRNHATGVSVGTLIGSNITNPLVAIGLGSMISTYFVPRPLVYWDLPMETVTAALLLVWLLFSGRKLKRAGGVYLIGLYAVYLAVRVLFFAVD